MERGPDSSTYAAFIAAVVIGGANFIAVSFSNKELPPMFGATLRFTAAGILFLLIARMRGVPLARGRAGAGAALYGLLGFGAAYALLYYALTGLTAGTAAVILAAVPLFTLLIAVITGQETLSLRAVGGGVLALAGIAILSVDSLGGDLGVSYLIAAIVGTIAIAGSSVVAKALPEVHPLSMNAIGMVAGIALLVVSSLAFRESWALPTESRTLIALGWLVIVGSVLLFQLFLYVIKSWTASATVYALTAMPVVAVILGALLLDQPITAEVVAGGVMVIGAVYVGAVSRAGRPAEASLPEFPETTSESAAARE